MSTPSDPFAKLQAESDRDRLNLMKTELALCFTFSTIAARKYETKNQEAAEKSMANAERAYDAASRFTARSKFSHVTVGASTSASGASLAYAGVPCM